MSIFRWVAAVGATALATGAAAVPAGAAEISGGTTTLALDGLRAATGAQVRLVAVGGATRRGTTLTLPVAGGALSARGSVSQKTSAGLALRAGRRTLRLTALRLRLGSAPRLTAKSGRARVALFALSRSPLTSATLAAKASAPGGAAAGASARGAAPVASAAATTTTLTTRSAQLRLTRAGGRLLRARLGLARTPRGAVGSLRLQLRTATAPGAGGTTPAPQPDPPAAPAPQTPAPAPQTPAPAPQTPAPDTPAPVFPTPDPGAVLIPGLPSSQVTAGEATWSFRGSWLRYLAAGGGSVAISGGVTKTADGAYVYPVSGGSYDAAAGWGVDHAGTVTFLYPNHGIEIALGAPRIELGSRAVINVLLTNKSSASAGAPGEVDGDGVPRRMDFATLDLSGTVPQRDGATVTWTDVPVLLTAAGAEPFLAYNDGEPFGRITIHATVAVA